MSFLCTCDRDEPVCGAVEPRPSNSLHIFRYFDHLSKIPRLKVMLKCNQRRTEPRPDSQPRLTLDEVIQEAKEGQGTDSAVACRPPAARRSLRPSVQSPDWGTAPLSRRTLLKTPITGCCDVVELVLLCRVPKSRWRLQGCRAGQWVGRWDHAKLWKSRDNEGESQISGGAVLWAGYQGRGVGFPKKN